MKTRNGRVRTADATNVARLRLTLLACVATLFALSATAGAETRTPALTMRTALDRGILTEMNAVRAAKGIRALRLSPGLNAAAAQHSRTMARHGFFEHESRNGGAFWLRVKRFYGSAGYRRWHVGENLLWASPDIDAEAAVSMWLKSPGHRKILLDRDFRDVGLAAVHAAVAAGAYGGREVTIVTADFGARTR